MDKKTIEEMQEKVEKFAKFCSDERKAQLTANHLSENELSDILDWLTSSISEHASHLAEHDGAMQQFSEGGAMPARIPWMQSLNTIEQLPVEQQARIEGLGWFCKISAFEGRRSRFAKGPRITRLGAVVREDGRPALAAN